MLKILDVLIGVATVMLLFSMVVTLITQSILTAIGSRGRNLKNGLAGLLKQLDSTLPENLAGDVAQAVLKHPLVAGQWGALGSVIHRDELTMLLMELAAGQAPTQLEGTAKTALIKLLKDNGIDDPGAALKNIRDVALQLEAADPTLTNSIRNRLAIVQEAKSEYVAKIHGWFDQTMDRVSQRFTANAHAITFVISLIVAFAVQLDTVALVNRLASDEAVRAAVTDQAKAILDKAGQSSAVTGGGDQSAGTSKGMTSSTTAASASPTPAASPSATPATTPVASDTTSTAGKKSEGTPSPTPDPAQQKLYDLLDKNGLIVLPGDHWQFPDSNKLLGILVSSLLLALGAPFWYKALQSLLKLRSIAAQKDDQQRKARQTGSAEDESAPATPTSDGASPKALPQSFQGEQGDLKAVG